MGIQTRIYPTLLFSPHCCEVMIHETAIVEEGVQMGEGVEVWHFSLVRAGAFLGDNCRIGHHVYIGPDVILGHGVKVKDGAKIFGEVTIGRHAFIGPGVVITDDRYPRSRVEDYPHSHTRIFSGASIGANSVLLPGVSIGRNAMIGAGSIVLTDVPPETTIYGVWK